MKSTQLGVVLVIFAVLCLKLECGVCDDTTTNISTSSAYLLTDTTLFKDAITNAETATTTTNEETTTEDGLTTTLSPCQAVPVELKNVTIYREEDVYRARWEHPSNKECQTYKVWVGTNDRVTKDNVVVLGELKLMRCTEVRIAAMDTANNVGNAVTRTVPDKIRNLEVTTDDHTIYLNWDEPADATCVSHYVIRLNGQSFDTKDTNFDLPDLEACTSHQGAVAAVSITDNEGPEDLFSAKTTKPISFTETVRNLQVKPTLDDITVSWEPPYKLGACVHNYKIELWDQHDDPESFTTDKLFHIISPIVPCMEYHFQIIPTLDESIYGRELQIQANAVAQATDPPTIQGTVWMKADMEVTVKVADYSANMCKIESIEVNCQYSGSDKPLWWMEETGNASFKYTNSGSSRPPEKILVSKLSSFTDYNCEVVVINIANSSKPKSFQGKTLHDVPNKPEDLKWSDDNDTGGNLSWSEPSKVPGILGNYNISVTDGQSDHFIPKSCAVLNIGVDSEEVKDNSYYFEGTLPNFKYSARVQASTGAGFGDEATLEFVAASRESEAVRNLSNDITNILGEDYDVMAHILWLIPCNTKGKLLEFTYEVVGTFLEDPEEILHDESKVTVNEDITNENYTFDIANIKPLYNYTVTVSAVTSSSDGTKITGEPETIVFLSPDGYPSAPKNVRVEDINSTAGVIRWDEPANKNGNITSYEITIQNEGPIHQVPDSGCIVDRNDINESVDGDEMSYQHSGFFSNFKYKVIVKASTTAGLGSSNEGYMFKTEPSPSEAVRQVSVVPVEAAPAEDYQAAIDISFTVPCHLNGVFECFQLTLICTRDGSSEEELFKETNYEQNTFNVQLKPEYYYTGFVEVNTTNFISKRVNIEPFTSQAGVPENSAKDLIEPKVVDPFTVDFELNKATFTNTMGEIRYFAIILAPGDFKPIQNYGFMEGGWPNTGHWSDDGDLKEYQTTPKEWNPFKSRGGKDSEYNYTIGKDNCDSSKDDYCNGPLRPDTEYSLRVRGFTSFGYRDTPKIIFRTPSNINYGALIGGIVGGAVGLLLIFIIIIICWRRRKTKKEMEETAMDTLSLMPAPIPINRFVAYYEDYNANLNKLKAEYSFLERKSASEHQLPTTFALTDDNKKKNRYINVLPYDETRVKLDRDKNDNYTDYINASFIKGYSGNVEYIATQGPLESTVVDFWRMVIQENVSVIVMVAQFVEHEKAKCHQYFPNNHETMNIGDGIEIRCANEIPLGGYIKRTLMVQRELMQMTITHIQYIQWPDFGCPENTESMLDFCNTFRQCVEQYKTKTIIHCSAGVGRTGTLIALDILFQTIDNKGDIDIFKTVLNLRKQRIRMVQTEKQYMFIHNCLAEYISNPKKEQELKEVDPIYENVVIKRVDDEEETEIP